MVNANPAANAFYSTAQIAWGSLLGGPFTGAYFLAHNFKLMGKPLYAKRCWWATVILFLALFSLGGFAYFGTSLYSILTIFAFALLAGAVAYKMQQPFLAQQVAAGKKGASNGHVLVTSLIGAGVTLLALILLTYLALFLLVFLYPPPQGHF